MNIVWSPVAMERASEIVDYIAADKPRAAAKWIHSLFRKVDRLKAFPEIGRIVPETNDNQFRELIFGNYRIIYRIEVSRISVLTIGHGRQILPVDEISEGGSDDR